MNPTTVVATFDNRILLWVGAIIVALVIGITRWLGDRFTKVVDVRLAARDRDEREYREEQEKEIIHQMKGQEITCDCLHELIYAVLHDEHNGGLEKVSKDLEDYRKENQELIRKKAARYETVNKN